jgi:DNA-binding NarL/FixJ family response regulator
MAANSLSDLNDIAVQIAQHEAAIGALKTERSKAIFALLTAGYSEREIALVAGLSGPRINQIKKEAHSG